MSRNPKPETHRRLATLRLLVVLAPLVFGPSFFSAAAEDLLIMADGGEFLGYDRGDGVFLTCSGAKITYGEEDRVSSTDEVCPIEDEDLPAAEEAPEEDPPPVI